MTNFTNNVLFHHDIAPMIFNLFDDQTHSSVMFVCKQWGPWMVHVAKQQKLSFLTDMSKQSSLTQHVITFTATNLKEVKSQFIDQITQIFDKCHSSTLPTLKPLFISYSCLPIYNKILEMKENNLATLETVFQIDGLDSAITFIGAQFKEKAREELLVQYFGKKLDKTVVRNRSEAEFLLAKYPELCKGSVYVQCVLKTIEKLFNENRFSEAFDWTFDNKLQPILKKLIVKVCVEKFININSFDKVYGLMTTWGNLFDSLEVETMIQKYMQAILAAENIDNSLINQSFGLLEEMNPNNIDDYIAALSKKSASLRPREDFKDLKAKYENEMGCLMSFLEGNRENKVEKAMQYYQEHAENPILRLGILMRVTTLVAQNKVAEADAVIKPIPEPFLRNQAQAICDSYQFKDVLTGIQENLNGISTIEDCLRVEKTSKEMHLPPSSYYFAQTMIVSRYVALDHGLERVREMIKQNPDNYFIGSTLIVKIIEFCKGKEIQKAEELYTLLTYEKEQKLAEHLITAAKYSL